MGKDSLIKSTSKKKKTSSKKDEDNANVEEQKAKTAKKPSTKAKKSTKAAPQKTKAAVKGKAAKPAKAKASKKSKATAKTKTTPKSKTAAAEKAATEKAAAEKAAAEKAAAEKAAAEKAAAEKAATEKAAAEKAAAERAAQEPKASISYAPPPDAAKPTDSTGRPLQIAIGVFAILIFLIIGASYLNKKHYHIKTVNGAIEVWQGNFAPKGTSRLVSLPGQTLDAPAKKVYSREEIYPLVFSYYKDKAITLMEVKGMPDFETVKFYLEQALCYSTTAKEKADVNAKINNIDFMVLMSKADAAMSKRTVASYEAALQHLGQAAKLDLEDFQQEQIKKKAALAQKTLKELKQKEAAAKEAAKKAQKASSAKKKGDTQKSDAKPKDVKAESTH